MLFAPAENYAHGPNPSESSPLGSDPKSEYENKHYSNFKRVFRIVIDGDAGSYYYPSADIITVQPLEEIKNPLNITHFVREFEMKVFTNELNADNEKQALTAMQVTLFRDLADKKKNLPQGEGDGKYTFAELINPQYNSQDAVSSTGKINPTTVFDKKFEHLWSSVPTGYNAKDKTSFVTLPGLVQSQYPYYFIEASSFVDKLSGYNTGDTAGSANCRKRLDQSRYPCCECRYGIESADKQSSNYRQRYQIGRRDQP